MKYLPLLLLLSGCFPPREFDCITAHGLYVVGGDCAAIDLVQVEIDREAEALGYGPNATAGYTVEARRGAGFTGAGGYTVGGESFCPGGYSVIAIPEGSEDWKHTSLAHELFHQVQHCVWDESQFQAAKNSGKNLADQTFDAQHPHWREAGNVYAAITRIQESK